MGQSRREGEKSYAIMNLTNAVNRAFQAGATLAEIARVVVDAVEEIKKASYYPILRGHHHVLNEAVPMDLDNRGAVLGRLVEIRESKNLDEYNTKDNIRREVDASMRLAEEDSD